MQTADCRRTGTATWQCLYSSWRRPRLVLRSCCRGTIKTLQPASRSTHNSYEPPRRSPSCSTSASAVCIVIVVLIHIIMLSSCRTVHLILTATRTTLALLLCVEGAIIQRCTGSYLVSYITIPNYGRLHCTFRLLVPLSRYRLSCNLVDAAMGAYKQGTRIDRLQPVVCCRPVKAMVCSS